MGSGASSRPGETCLECISEMAAHASKGSLGVGWEASELSVDRDRNSHSLKATGTGLEESHPALMGPSKAWLSQMFALPFLPFAFFRVALPVCLAAMPWHLPHCSHCPSPGWNV